MLLEPGGLLLTSSCSGGVGPILQCLEGACDRAITPVFPAGEYLKGMVVLKAARVSGWPIAVPASACTN